MDGKERFGCKNRESTNDDRGVALSEHRGLKVLKIPNLLRFPLCRRMDAGAEAAGVPRFRQPDPLGKRMSPSYSDIKPCLFEPRMNTSKRRSSPPFVKIRSIRGLKNPIGDGSLLFSEWPWLCGQNRDNPVSP